MSEEVAVRNAADADQVAAAVDKEDTGRQRELMDLAEVLSTPAGRRLVWRVMAWCGSESTPKRQTSELTYMAIGSGEVGRWLKSEVIEAGEELLFQMMRENIEKRGDGNGNRRRRK
jgi:hypothetical protein